MQSTRALFRLAVVGTAAAFSPGHVGCGMFAGGRRTVLCDCRAEVRVSVCVCACVLSSVLPSESLALFADPSMWLCTSAPERESSECSVVSAAAARADTDRACADTCAYAALLPRDVACTAAHWMKKAAVPTQRAGVRGASCALEHSPSRRRVLCLASALVSATVAGTAVPLVRARECAGLCASRSCGEREGERKRASYGRGG
jgi:hypothetical protein